MPRRSNLFQDVVAIVETSMAGDASVEESAMLPNRTTGDLREVDVLITSKIGGHTVRIGIEASRTNRRRSVEWVEQLLCKHAELPTDKLIIVSEKGVSAQGKRLAEAKGATVIASEDLSASEDVGHEIVNQLKSIWPRTITIDFTSCDVQAQAPNSLSIWRGAPYDLEVVAEDGREIGHLGFTLTAIVEDNWPTVIRQLEAFGIEETADRDLNMQVQNPVARLNDSPTLPCLRWVPDDDTPTQYHPILSLAATGKCHITVQQIDLKHCRLGDVSVAYGQAESSGSTTTLVSTAVGDTERIYLRTRTNDGKTSTTELHPMPEPIEQE